MRIVVIARPGERGEWTPGIVDGRRERRDDDDVGTLIYGNSERRVDDGGAVRSTLILDASPVPGNGGEEFTRSAEKEKKKKLENAPSFKAAKTYKGNEQIAEIVPLQRDFPKGKLVGKVERMLSMLIRKSENDMQGTRMVPYTRGLKGRLYTMITSAFLTFGFAIPITYPAAVKYEMPLEIHENGLEGLNGMSDKEVRKYRENCAAFVKPIGTVRVKKAGMGHFKLKKNENKDYDEWPKHTKRHFVFAMIAHVAMINEFAKNGTYSIPDTTTTVEV